MLKQRLNLLAVTQAALPATAAVSAAAFLGFALAAKPIVVLVQRFNEGGLQLPRIE
jgi:hypothetical protein